MRYKVCPVQGLLTTNVQRTAKARNRKYLWFVQKCSFVQKATTFRWSAALFWPRHLNRACSPNICCAAARSCVLHQGSPWTRADAYYNLPLEACGCFHLDIDCWRERATGPSWANSTCNASRSAKNRLNSKLRNVGSYFSWLGK
jgi:hypothetical protein